MEMRRALVLFLLFASSAIGGERYADTRFWKPLEPSAGTFGLWHFDGKDEKDPKAFIDASQLKHPISITGNVSITQNGRFNSALQIEGGALEIKLKKPLPVDQHFAADAWIWLSSYPEEEGYVLFRDYERDKCNGWSLAVTSDGCLVMRWLRYQGEWNVTPRPQEVKTPSGTVPLKKWVHVGITFRWKQRASIYVNGVEKGFTLYLNRWGVLDGLKKELPENAGSIFVGNNRKIESPFPGYIDEFRISGDIIEFFPYPDQSWTDPEGKREMKQGLPYLPEEKDILLYASFDRTTTPEIMKKGKLAPYLRQWWGWRKPEFISSGVRGRAFVGSFYIEQKDLLTSEEGTIEFWFKPLSWSNVNSKGNVATGPFKIYTLNLGMSEQVLLVYFEKDGKRRITVGGKHFPEKWRHIVLSWKGNYLKIYLDGEPVNKTTLNNGTFAEVLSPHYLGFCGDNAYDEIGVYNRMLTDAEARNCYYRYRDPSQMAPITTNVEKLCYLAGIKGIFAQVDCSRTPEVKKVFFAIRDKEGNSIWKSVPEDVGEPLRDIVKKVPQLRDGEYNLHATFLKKDGSLFEKHTRSFNVKHFPWENNEIGKEKIIIPPYTPISINENTLKPWGREVKIGKSGLPEKITVLGRQILAAPVRLVSSEGGVSHVLVGEELIIKDISGFRVQNREEYLKAPLTSKISVLKLKESSGYQALVSASGRLGSLKASLQGTFDIDGWYRIKLTLSPQSATPVKVEDLDFLIEMPEKYADTMCNQIKDRPSGEFGNIPKGKGEVWNSLVLYQNNQNRSWKSFVPQVFIGNGDQGLWWFAVSSEGWILKDDEPCVRFERENGKVRLRIRIIAGKELIDRPRTIDFSLLPEPVKPMRKRWREIAWGWEKNKNYYGLDPVGYRYYGDSLDSYALHTEEDYKQLNAFFHEFGKITPYYYWYKNCEKAFRDEVPFTLYGSTWMTGLGMEEFKYFGQEWLGNEKWKTYPDYNFEGTPSYGSTYTWTTPEQLTPRYVNFNSTYLDCFIWYHKNLFERCPVNGTWWDNASIGFVTEYVPEKGRVEVWNTYLRRELTRRLAIMGYKIGRRPWWLMNMHVDFSWCQVGWHIENKFYIEGKAKTIIDQLGVGKFRALLRTKGGLIGRLASLASHLKGDELILAQRSIIGMSLLHDIGVFRFPPMSMFKNILSLLEESVHFFSGNPEFLPYWRQQVVRFEEPMVLASFFIGNGNAIAVIVNASDNPVTLTTPRFDIGKLGLENIYRVVDAETGGELKEDVFSIAHHDFRLLILEGEDEK